MIIKKKYTTIKKTAEESPIIEEPIIEDVSVQVTRDVVKKEDGVVQPTVQTQEETSKEKKKKKEDNLDLSLDNIKFEQREERREGTRRRGYRRTEDRNIVSRAQKDALAIKEEAKKEGYEEGLASAKNDIEDLKSKFTEFFNYKTEVYEKVSDCIYEVSMEIARKIINKQVETDKEYIISMIKGVVEEIHKTENKITLKVMPKDVEIVRDKISEIFSGEYFEAKISVIPDNEIKEGGVIVETSNGIIDATLETQLSIIEKALKKQEES
ncbi:TPA: hypothetical protein IAA87_10300 [Candidatus Avigastranaerophilus faecigallinarum]|nr:hypothetical protein [Candidatus Avigastranaerophilus faecigallinarum]